MSLKDRIQDDIKTAMKAGEKDRVATLRMVKAQMQGREVELRSKHGLDYVLEDEEALGVLTRAAKQRRESIASYREGGREELAAAEEAELALIGTYLPEALGEAELEAMVKEAIAEAGATSPKQMGLVMKLLVPKTRGRADGKLVSEMVKTLLAGGS